MRKHFPDGRYVRQENLVPLTPDDAKVREQKPIWPRISIMLIAILALAIRLAWLGSKSLWIDEAHSFYFADHTFSEIFTALCDPHPPGYYVLLRVFLSLGESEFWLRLPSAIAGTLTVLLLYALGRELAVALDEPWASRRVATLASLLLAVAPLHVWYSQEARMYALVTMFGVGAAYFAVRFALGRRKIDALVYTLVAAAAMYVDQSSGLPLLIANLLWGRLWLYQRKSGGGRNWRECVIWVSLQLIVVLLFWLWWSRALFSELFDVGTFYQLVMVQQILGGLGLSMSLGGLQWVLVIVGAVCAAAGLLIYALAIRSRWRSRLTTVMAAAMLALFVVITIGSAVPRGFTVKRLLLSLLPYALFMSAWAMWKLRLNRWALLALASCSALMSGYNVLVVSKAPWREVVTVVGGELSPNDVLWVDELAVPVFDYYGDLQGRHIWRATHIDELGHSRGLDQQNAIGRERIWVVAVVDPYRNLLDYISPSWNAVWSEDWYRISVRAYALPLPDAGLFTEESDLPSWLLEWPSPMADVCQGHE